MTRNVTDGLSWDQESGRDDPAQRFRLYRLCDCPACSGEGKIASYEPADVRTGSTLNADGSIVHYGVPGKRRCPDCRGEGRSLELVATCADPAAVGVALVTLGREGEWSECPVGVLDTMGEKDEKWIVRPWLPSARNVSDAGRTLAITRWKP